MWSTALENFTPDMWANSVRHCEELIREDWKKLMGNLPTENIPTNMLQLSAKSVVIHL